MKYFTTFIGSLMAGIFVMSNVWTTFNNDGLLSGYIGGVLIISSMWILNHHLNFIHNGEDGVFIDMALAIGIAGIVRDTLLNGIQAFQTSFPTLFFVLIGGILGGIVSYLIESFELKERVGE